MQHSTPLPSNPVYYIPSSSVFCPPTPGSKLQKSFQVFFSVRGVKKQQKQQKQQKGDPIVLKLGQGIVIEENLVRSILFLTEIGVSAAVIFTDVSVPESAIGNTYLRFLFFLEL